MSPAGSRSCCALTSCNLCVQIYLPGIDGTGMAAYKQFPSITERFALMALTVPIENRMPFQELAAFCADHVRDLAAATPSETPIYLLGESFGGILALAVAAQCRDAVDRVVLVNPATSYEDSVWPQVRYCAPRAAICCDGALVWPADGCLACRHHR